MSEPLLKVRGLARTYQARLGAWPFGKTVPLRAVDGVSFELGAGRTLGLVGESGCGKTTTAKLVLGLVPASAGEVDRSTLHAAAAGPAKCGSGERAGLVKDPGACRRISGYVAAGSRWGTDEGVGGRRSPFGPLDAPRFVGAVRAAGAALMAAPAAGLERILAVPNAADEAR